MKSKHKPTFRSDIKKKLSAYVWRQKKPFEFCKLKKSVFGYCNYGGSKGKRKIKQVFGLREFKKDNRIWLQKIPEKQKQELTTNDNN